MARAAFGETARSDWSIAGRYSPIMPTDIMKFLMPGFWTDRQFRQNCKQTRIDKQKPKTKKGRVNRTEVNILKRKETM